MDEVNAILKKQAFAAVTKKPVVVGAVIAGVEICIPTPEGNLWANPEDVIVCGVKGEFYPCKAEIYKATYEEDYDSLPVFDPDADPKARAAAAKEAAAQVKAEKAKKVKAANEPAK